jgi:polyribonucleotide nucleotidyltransferase
VAATKDAIVMVEGEALELTEAEMVEALQFGKDAVQGVLELQERHPRGRRRGQVEYTAPEADTTVAPRVR